MIKLYTVMICLSLVSYSVNKQQSNQYDIFIGKEIDVLLNDPEFSNYKDYVFLEEPPRKLQGIGFINDSGEFYVYVEDFKHVERFSKHGEWEFDKVVKEKISRLRVYNKDKALTYDSENK